MEVEIILGNPKIKCDGYGICKFITKSSSLKISCMNIDQLVKAKLGFERSHLSVLLDRKSITQAAYEKYFIEGVFKVECDVDIPIEISEYFQETPSVLVNGTYKIEFLEDYMKVNILTRIDENFVKKTANMAA